MKKDFVKPMSRELTLKNVSKKWKSNKKSRVRHLNVWPMRKNIKTDLEASWMSSESGKTRSEDSRSNKKRRNGPKTISRIC